MRRESSAAKRRPKMLRPREDGHPGGGSYNFDVYLEKAFARVSVPRIGVCPGTYEVLLDTGY